MAIKFQLSRQAAAEYEAIVNYLAIQLKSPQAARAFQDEFIRVIELACIQPESFPLSQHQRLAQLGYHKVPINNYIALYTLRENTLIVAHVFHQRQDYARLV
jgi:plasmid stabilization system protein ParE